MPIDIDATNKLLEVRTRVENALKSLNQKTVTTADVVSGRTVEAVADADFYDFKVTHLNSTALQELERSIHDFAAETVTEEKVRECIRQVRNTSRVAYLDFHIRALEPTVEEFERISLMLDLEPTTSLLPIYHNDETKLAYLLERSYQMFRELVEESEFKSLDYRRYSPVVGDPITKVQRQYVKYLKRARRMQIPISEAQHSLYSAHYETDFVIDRRDFQKDLSRYDTDETILEKDMFTRDDEILPSHATSKEQDIVDDVMSEIYEMESDIVPAYEKSTIAIDGVQLTDCDRVGYINVIPDQPQGIYTVSAESPKPVERHTSTENLPASTEPSVQADSNDIDIVPAIEDAPISAEVYHGGRIETTQRVEEQLSEEDKALAAGLEEDGSETDDEHEQEPQQSGLFGDISVEKVSRRIMYSDDQMIDAAFEYHRQQGFPYRDISPAMAMKELQELAETEDKTLISTRLCYQVADTFHRHRLHAAAAGMSSPFDSFNDNKKLRKAIRLELKLAGKPRIFAGGMMTLVNGTQACSNFRPGFAAYLYRKYAPENAVVLDTSTGYGGRLLGAVASQTVAHYIGIDPNVPTYQANINMVEKLQLRTLMEFTLYNLPAEDVDIELVRNRCDFSFTSPPYLSKERYSDDDTQSWKRYPTGNSWKDGFLLRMMELTYAALKPGSTSIVNIAPVKIKGTIYPLDEWTIECAEKCGFTHVETDRFPMVSRFGKGMADEVAFEPVIVFKKEK